MLPEHDATIRNKIHVGLPVGVVKKQDQKTGVITFGTVKQILTNSPTHPRGIKVMLDGGIVGRVQKISKFASETKSVSDLGSGIENTN